MTPSTHNNKSMTLPLSTGFLLVLLTLMSLQGCGGGGGGQNSNTQAPGVVNKLSLYYYSCAGFSNGGVKCWGTADDTGQGLGYGKVLSSLGDEPGEMGDELPALDMGLNQIPVQVVAGARNSCARMVTGKIKCWGSNYNGQLGLPELGRVGDEPGELGENLPFIELGAGVSVENLDVSNNHSCAVLSDNNIKCWGANSSGELGLGDREPRGGKASEMGDGLPNVNLGTGRTALTVSTGQRFTCALLDDFSVKCWGSYRDGRLGVPGSANIGVLPEHMGDNLAAVDLGTGRTARAISTGRDHACAVLDDNSVKCWGNNGSGKLGLGDTNHRGDDINEMGDNLPIVDLGTGRSAKVVSAGTSHTCALLDNDSVKCWGQSVALGQGDTVTRGDSPNEMGDNLIAVDLGAGRTAQSVKTGSGFSCALLDNNDVKCWGFSMAGQLGLGSTDTIGDNADEMGELLLPVNLGAGRTALGIDTFGSHVCALLDNSAVKCWGGNDSAQLGTGTGLFPGDEPGEMGSKLPFINLGTGAHASSIAAGNGFTCALLDNGSVKCWGYGGAPLGQGHTTDIGSSPEQMGNNIPPVKLGSGRRAKAIVSGESHVCALLDNNNLKCWGVNTYGQLGLGDTTDRGDKPNQMGDDLLAVDLGSGRSAVEVVAGQEFTCAILDDGSVKCWGNNRLGALGQGDGLSRGDQANEMGDNLLAIDLGTNRTAIALAAGERTACAILDDNSVKCWGQGSLIGAGNGFTRGDNPGEMGDALLPVDLGASRTAIAIDSRGAHTCALLDDKSIKCWGANYLGQLGAGHTDVIGNAPGQMGDNLLAINLGAGRTAKQVKIGVTHTCAILDDDSLKCWGNNFLGALGLGDTETRGDEASEMGDNLPAVNLLK